MDPPLPINYLLMAGWAAAPESVTDGHDPGVHVAGSRNLYPIVALLIELQRRGHRIVLRTLAEGVSTGLDLGFEASPIDGRIEATVMTDWMAPNSRTALKLAFDFFGQRASP